MTPIDRFERRLPSELRELAAERTPDYLDDLLTRTAPTRQRPRWTFPERWLPMTITLRRPMLAPPMRLLAIGLTLLLLAAAGLAAASWLQRRDALPAVVVLEHPEGLVAYSTGGAIWTFDPATDERVPVAEDGAWPLWSPTGGDLFFWRGVTDGDLPMVLDAESAQPRALTGTALDTAQDASWSPSGDRVAISSQVDGRSMITVLAIDGVAQPSQLSMPETLVDWPEWVPADADGGDGGVLARVTQTGPRGGASIYRLASDGGSAELIVSDGAVDVSVGRRTTLFGALYDLQSPVAAGLANPDAFAYTQLHDIDGDAPDGNGFRVHVFDGTVDRAIEWRADADDEAWPVWDPSATRVAFESFESDEAGSRIVIMDVSPDGSLAPVSTDVIAEEHPNNLSFAWSPDGTRLLVVDHGNSQRAWMVDATTGVMTLLDWTSDSAPSWRP